ncbi:choice-of-anchor P family protein [Streptomyces sp. LS1784]|uniref:choice-of-anchor P family protein n=1 Tax=Streptomyces sp. LS1784 TaxID=2851533 RepID=UPI001CCBBF51|nr:choice-of-anchor P family protein [Streptomyces sp. LS1784]
MVGALSTASPAYAALPAPVADAYVVSTQALGGVVAVAPSPESAYPSGGTRTLVGLDVGPVATTSVLTATTAGNPVDGTASASATVDKLGLDLGVASVALTGVNSTCNATPTGATGSGLIAGGTVTVGLLPVSLQANAPADTRVDVPLVGSIVLNEQTTDADGVLTVNAVHITLLPSLNGANLVIGHAQCGGAEPAAAVPMINPSVAGTGGGAVLAGILATVHVRRRNARSAASTV